MTAKLQRSSVHQDHQHPPQYSKPGPERVLQHNWGQTLLGTNSWLSLILLIAQMYCFSSYNYISSISFLLSGIFNGKTKCMSISIVQLLEQVRWQACYRNSNYLSDSSSSSISCKEQSRPQTTKPEGRGVSSTTTGVVGKYTMVIQTNI